MSTIIDKLFMCVYGYAYTLVRSFSHTHSTNISDMFHFAIRDRLLMYDNHLPFINGQNTCVCVRFSQKILFHSFVRLRLNGGFPALFGWLLNMSTKKILNKIERPISIDAKN